MDESVFEEKSSFKMFGLTFSSKLDWGSYITPFAKSASIKIEVLIFSMKFLSPEVKIYHTPMHGILMSYLGWYSKLLLGIIR